MGNHNQSRRNFLSRLLPNQKPTQEGEKITMLTADGKLVSVDRPTVKSKPQKKTSNAEILKWVQSQKSDKGSL